MSALVPVLAHPIRKELKLCPEAIIELFVFGPVGTPAPSGGSYSNCVPLNSTFCPLFHLFRRGDGTVDLTFA